ncbi:MAG: hypothetical protein ACLTAF_13760 [Blautia coccoides]
MDKMYTMDEIFDYIWNIAAEFQNGRRRSVQGQRQGPLAEGT